jgi:antitoxin VapB
MASLFIKDKETAALVSRVAERSGMTKTALVKELAAAREAELDRAKPLPSAREKLEKFWRENPLGNSTGLKADKAFFDELWGEDPD